MKRLKISWFGKSLGLLFCAALLHGCGGGNSPDQSGTTLPRPLHITSATTWSAGQVHRVSGEVHVSAPLTIEPGTVVKFDTGASLIVSINGSISAQGSAASPIVFTSMRDDSQGGDSNGDSNLTFPVAGDWTGITLRQPGSTFSHCQFLYGGRGNRSALLIEQSAAITNSIFAHNGDTDSIDASPALNAWDALPGTVIANNTFYDNKVPLGMGTTFNLDDSNRFDNALAAPAHPQPNKYNGINLAAGGVFANDVTLAAARVPIVVGKPAKGYVQIDTNATLTLGDEVVFKFFSGGGIDVFGDIVASASPGKKITFTSIRDDARGGDTNGDGGGSLPEAGSWSSIWVTGSSSRFINSQFLYGGSGIPWSPDGLPALDARGAGAATVITGNTFYGNLTPLGISTSFSLDDSNSFDTSAASSSSTQSKKYNCIMVAGGSTVAGDISWKETQVPFVIGTPGEYNYLKLSATLTLGDRVVLKFHQDGALDFNTGGNLAIGQDAVLTSINDDLLGDTNSGGQAPAEGDWDGFFYYSTNSWFPQAPATAPAYMRYVSMT